MNEEKVYLDESGLTRLLNKFGDSVTRDAVQAVTSGSTDLPTSGAVYTAINNAIGAALAASY